MRILYIGPEIGTSIQRIRALERLGHQVTVIDPEKAFPSNALTGYWNFHTGYLGFEWLIKHYVLGQARKATFDLILVDHGESLSPSTLMALKRAGKPLLNYNQDNPYVSSDGRRWRLFLKGVPIYDLLAMKSVSAEAARARGARRVLPVYVAADEIVHRPIGLSEEERARFSAEVVFVGTWQPERGPFMLRLIERGVPLRIYGGRWRKDPEFEKLQPYLAAGNLVGDDYVKAIAGASIAIGLLFKAYRDLHTTRSAEIPAIGTLFCAERTSEHLAMYKDGEEAVFWDDADECADKCLELLSQPDRIKKIAAAGRRRALENGNFNEKLLTKIISAGIAA